MSRLSKQHFWNWFSRHHQEYLTLISKSKKETAYWLSELTTHLRTYYRSLDFSLDCPPGKTATLTITVCGKAKHFKQVDDMVAKAPEIAGWRFVALEEPRPIDFFMEKEIRDSGIDPRELRFSFDDDDADYTALSIYHPLCTEENYDLIYRLAYAAIFNLLGERSFAIDIRRFEVYNLSMARPADDIQELEVLPDCMGMRRSGIVVDDRGNLVNRVDE
jgi:hypothetical protein